MFSVPAKPITPTPVFVTKARKARKDKRAVATDASIDTASETAKPSDMSAKPVDAVSNSDDFESAGTRRKRRRLAAKPVVKRLEAPKDRLQLLEAEQPDQADIAMQANEAYRALRQPDEEITPVATI